LVQRGGAKRNNPPINGQCTNYRTVRCSAVLMCLLKVNQFSSILVTGTIGERTCLTALSSSTFSISARRSLVASNADDCILSYILRRLAKSCLRPGSAFCSRSRTVLTLFSKPSSVAALTTAFPFNSYTVNHAVNRPLDQLIRNNFFFI